MPVLLQCVPESAIVVGYDFSTTSAKALAFDLAGRVVAEAQQPTRLYTAGGVAEMDLAMLAGQVAGVTRTLAGHLREAGRLADWRAVGISATHHTAGRIDAAGNQVRRAICWMDQTLAKYHAEGVARLGGPDAVAALIGGPWAERYTLSHLVKDETTLPAEDWEQTRWIAQHGSLAAGYLTGRFDCVSRSAAASTGMLNLRTGQWADAMLGALADPGHRTQARANLPAILAEHDPVGPLSAAVAADAGIDPSRAPLVFPTLDDQAAGLVGGGAVDAGQVAVILGTSAVVNSSSAAAPRSGSLDAMRLNWGPYLWMRCYSNGALFLDRVVGPDPDWPALERAARAVPPGAGGVTVLPFLLSEPSIGVSAPHVAWSPAEPTDPGVRVRAVFEALSYLIALAVREHEAAGQVVTRVTVSGGVARSDLMTEILASVLDRPLERLQSAEGPALGAAVAALAGLESVGRVRQGIAEPYTVADAVGRMVRFRSPATPRPEWVPAYRSGLAAFGGAVAGLRG